MKTYKVGVIRVLTTEDETVLNRHGKLLERYYPMFQVTSRCIPEQFEGVHDEETERQSIPKVVALAEEMYREGFDAVIVSCAGDPGVRGGPQTAAHSSGGRRGECGHTFRCSSVKDRQFLVFWMPPPSLSAAVRG